MNILMEPEEKWELVRNILFKEVKSMKVCEN